MVSSRRSPTTIRNRSNQKPARRRSATVPAGPWTDDTFLDNRIALLFRLMNPAEIRDTPVVFSINSFSRRNCFGL